jgi:hypothetical protein
MTNVCILRIVTIGDDADDPRDAAGPQAGTADHRLISNRQAVGSFSQGVPDAQNIEQKIAQDNFQIHIEQL